MRVVLDTNILVSALMVQAVHFCLAFHRASLLNFITLHGHARRQKS